MKYNGFAPCFFPEAEILILGSFPSVKSREVSFYYGNPQNRFWRMLANIFHLPLPTSIEQKQQLLKQCKIALWDIVTSCEIVGSLDSNIKNYAIANLNEVFKCVDIKKILLNGKKTAEIFLRYYKDIHIPYFILPSTSPANTGFDISAWEKCLK